MFEAHVLIKLHLKLIFSASYKSDSHCVPPMWKLGGCTVDNLYYTFPNQETGLLLGMRHGDIWDTWDQWPTGPGRDDIEMPQGGRHCLCG